MFTIDDKKLRLRSGHWQKLCYDISDVMKSVEASSSGSFVDSEDKACFERVGAYIQMAFFIAYERSNYVTGEYVNAQKEKISQVLSSNSDENLRRLFPND